jgi:hypothetical protein
MFRQLQTATAFEANRRSENPVAPTTLHSGGQVRSPDLWTNVADAIII